VSKPYTLFVAIHGKRLVVGTAGDRSAAVLATDASLCRLYDSPAILPSAHNLAISGLRNVVCALDLTRWPANNHCHVLIISPLPPDTPPPMPF
jgi:hypothetical protein